MILNLSKHLRNIRFVVRELKRVILIYPCSSVTRSTEYYCIVVKSCIVSSNFLSNEEPVVQWTSYTVHVYMCKTMCTDLFFLRKHFY